eukprot:gene6539-7835_t
MSEAADLVYRKSCEAVEKGLGDVGDACFEFLKFITSSNQQKQQALVKAAATLKDVVREVDELELGGKDGDEADYELEDEADDVVDFDTDFGPEDVKIVDAAKPLMAGSLALAKSIVKAVATGSEPAEEKDLLVLERLNEQVRKTTVGIENLGAALYEQVSSGPSAKMRRVLMEQEESDLSKAGEDVACGVKAAVETLVEWAGEDG